MVWVLGKYMIIKYFDPICMGLLPIIWGWRPLRMGIRDVEVRSVLENEG